MPAHRKRSFGAKIAQIMKTDHFVILFYHFTSMARFTNNDYFSRFPKKSMEKFAKNLKKKLNICELPVRNFCNQAHKDILNI